MTSGVLLGVVTAAMLIAFAAIAVWAWLPARRADFARAAELPLKDDEGTSR
ncbi:MAG TPA: CcoQ/FixQ family Cbb3-type cytochrome c oxidase assembly chaperone [Xanthomonadales bacterium]|nr:CcoQ/FixQ family Cbb3-type cytochrome c oxidase assembly chaperone [Xanthomonadales bacterium]